MRATALITCLWLSLPFSALPLAAVQATSRRLLLKPADGDFVDLGGKAAGRVRLSFNKDLDFRGDYLVFWIADAEYPPRRGPLTVKRSVPADDFLLRNIAQGRHRVTCLVVKAPPSWDAEPSHSSLMHFEVMDQTVAVITMRDFKDLVPSYNWQKAEPWHRLPPGLEIKMDLDKGGSRARIPQPWIWKVKVHLAAFPNMQELAVEVRAETRPADILASLAEQLGDPSLVRTARMIHQSGEQVPTLSSSEAFFNEQNKYTITDSTDYFVPEL
ncbi:unnamed protein product [Polarella glacialis]|uniref:Uncharacterized protein n=1 Tax=Polarella glacialis TaxID=89957 RepID=A0A813G2Z5_POLGL|nr:unnamed protein product [Polarella glacialis]